MRVSGPRRWSVRWRRRCCWRASTPGHCRDRACCFVLPALAAVASGHVAGLALGAVLIGLGHGLEGPMASHLLATHVAPQRRALWFSVKQTGVQVGAVAASFSLPVLAALTGGWRAAAFVVALLALAAVALLALPARKHAVPLAARSAAGAIGRVVTISGNSGSALAGAGRRGLWRDAGRAERLLRQLRGQ